jgi:hypothetical protein
MMLGQGGEKSTGMQNGPDMRYGGLYGSLAACCLLETLWESTVCIHLSIHC